MACNYLSQLDNKDEKAKNKEKEQAKANVQTPSP